MNQWPTYPRETNEWVPWEVTIDGAPTTTGVSFALVPQGVRPGSSDWAGAVVRDYDGTPTTGFLIVSRQPGTYRLFARGAGSNGSAPVIDCGLIQVS